MTDFTTPAEFRADLQRRFDAFDDVLRSHRLAIAEVEREREMVALQIATIERVMAMQPQNVSGITLAQLAGEEPFVAPPVFRDWCEEHNRGSLPNGLCPECEARNQQRSTGPQPAPVRQRADVRGPVLALIRQRAAHGEELTAEDIIHHLPDLRPASIRAALDAAVRMGTIAGKDGLYWAPVAAPDAALAAATPTAAANPDDRHSEDGGRHPGALASGVAAAALAKSVQENEDRRVPRHIVEPEPPDARVIRDTSPEALAANLRAAIEHAGPSGLNEENACIPPIVIAAGIEAGWLERTEDDRGPRLWLREGAGQC